MAGAAARPAPGLSRWLGRIRNRELDAYPDTGPRVMYLAITVLATITLYYLLYVDSSVATLELVNLHMSFTFFVLTGCFGALIGAFGSAFAGLADRFGRVNLVVFGLLFAGVFVAFIIPAATSKWVFTIEWSAVGFVEGVCLVAAPALIRDFSPQVGRATAMGFWTTGPTMASLIVAVVGTVTIPAVVTDPRFWTHEYRIGGTVGLVVCVIAFVGLRELSPQLRDQLMVTMRDRALIQARAKGLSEADIEAALRHPFRQLFKPEIVISAVAVSVMLLGYFTAVGFSVIYLTTVFGFSVKDANGLGNWNWGFNVIAVILVGVLSDRVRVRKPFMVIGGVLAAVMTVVYLEQAGRHPGYYTLAIMLALLALGLGVAFPPWMASYTETVEHRNPALIATGLAIWGWTIRMVIFVSFLMIPLVINAVTPLVTYGPAVSAYATTYGSELAFAQAHAPVVAAAAKYQTQLADAANFAPEVAVVRAHPALFARLGAYASPAAIPPKLAAQAVAAAGGGVRGASVLAVITANKAAIQGVIAVEPQLSAIAPYSAQLAALSRVPPGVFAYLNAHGAAVTKAAADIAGQWKTWYWICFGGIVFFLLSIPLLRGRWRPRSARRDEAEHEAMVRAELAKLTAVTG